MTQRTVEVLSAGCELCSNAEALVREVACSSCDVTIVDVSTEAGAARAREVGATRVPAVVVDGVLLGCCAGRGVDEATLRAAGVGQAS